MKVKTSMNLFEIMDAMDQLDERLKEVERNSHEPQNYREKCEALEKRIEELERQVERMFI